MIATLITVCQPWFRIRSRRGRKLKNRWRRRAMKRMESE